MSKYVPQMVNRLIMFYITRNTAKAVPAAKRRRPGNFIASCRSEIVFSGLGVDMFTQIISGESQEEAYAV